MTVHFQDDTITLHHGDALEVARTLDSGSVDCIVTSPPYYGLRDYGSEGQYGLEESPAAYVETMRALFNELRRVLADDGTLWLNIGDSYQSTGGHTSQGETSQRAGRSNVKEQHRSTVKVRSGLPNKNLLGIPWRVAFALQDDGWILRNSIIWQKPNAMPESVTDRLSTRHENIFLLSKSQKYWFDLDPIREKLLRPEAADGTIVFGGKKSAELQTGSSARRTGRAYTKGSPDEAWNGNAVDRPHAGYRGEHEDGKNPGDVWSITTKPFTGAHFAVFPPEIPRRAILAGCKPGGVVLDPFHGSGTTGKVATENGHRYVGIDISADYLDLSLRTRLSTGTLDLEGML